MGKKVHMSLVHIFYNIQNNFDVGNAEYSVFLLDDMMYIARILGNFKKQRAQAHLLFSHLQFTL